VRGLPGDDRRGAWIGRLCGAVDVCGTFSETKREAGLLRMRQAGVVVSDYATLRVEILKDNGRPEAGPVYEALDMPWATLVGQIASAMRKERIGGGSARPDIGERRSS
jgi:hypothetical protein